MPAQTSIRSCEMLPGCLSCSYRTKHTSLAQMGCPMLTLSPAGTYHEQALSLFPFSPTESPRPHGKVRQAARGCQQRPGSVGL